MRHRPAAWCSLFGVQSADQRYPRRTVLGVATRTAGATGMVAGLGLVGLAGCQLIPTEARWRSADPLTPLLSGTVALARRYDEIIAALPSLRARLEPLRETHRAHVVALAREIGVDERAPVGSARPTPQTAPSPTPTGSTAPSGSAAPTGSGATGARPSTTPLPTAVPSDPTTAVDQLVVLERYAQQAAAAACLSAPGYRAALLGSIAACRATHLESLR